MKFWVRHWTEVFAAFSTFTSSCQLSSTSLGALPDSAMWTFYMTSGEVLQYGLKCAAGHTSCTV